MRKRLQLFSFTLVLFLAAVVFSLNAWIREHALKNQGQITPALKLVTENAFKETLKANNLEGHTLNRITRSQNFDKVFIELGQPNSTNSLLLCLMNGAVTTNRVSGSAVGINNNGQIVAVRSRDKLSLLNHSTIELKPEDRFGFSPGANYMFFYRKGEALSVSLTSSKSAPLEIANDGYFPLKIYEIDSGAILFCRRFYKQNPSKDITGLYISEQSGKLVLLQETLQIDDAGGVVEMAPKDNLVIIETHNDLLPQFASYDIVRKKRLLIGPATNFAILILRDPHSSSLR